MGAAKFSALGKACSHHSSLLLLVLTSVPVFSMSLGKLWCCGVGLLIIMWCVICVVNWFPVLAAPFSNQADGK